VGSEMSDSCKEAKVQLEVASLTLVKHEKIVDTFNRVFEHCGTGKYNIECVSRAAYQDEPEDYLEWCDAKMGPQATASGAVCRFAKMTLDQYRVSALGYSNLVKILKWSQDSCRSVPYECIANSDQCLRAKDIQFCFLECVKKGNMKHQMLTKPEPPNPDGIHACLDFSDTDAGGDEGAAPAAAAAVEGASFDPANAAAAAAI
jgi:hypothetical protein